MESNKTIIYVVDDDESVLGGLKRLLVAKGFVCFTFTNAWDFLQHKIDSESSCLILDVNLPDLDGLALHDRLKSKCALPVVFLTGYGDVSSTVRAMKAGAIDFLEKPVEQVRLLEAISQALRCQDALRDKIHRQNRAQFYHSRLTQREQDVMNLVVTGLLNKQIAASLGITEGTVKTHRGRVMEKMEVDSLAELVLLANELGLFEEAAATALAYD